MSLRKDLLEKYGIRKTKAQKSDFISYAESYAKGLGYSVKVEGKGDSIRNIVIGDVSRAKVVYTAHYDTPPTMILPNFITPKNIFIYILYQIMLVALLLVLPLGLALVLKYTMPDFADGTVSLIVFILLYYAEMFLMLYGPANKNNSNDNTSGVATVLGIAERLAGQGTPAAFVLFDCEERGLLGSKLFNKQHKDLMKNKLVLNFDCVSDGEYMMFVGKRGSRDKMPLIEEAFPSGDGISCLYETKWVIYPSDQSSFPVGVGVAAMQRTKGGLLYTDKIHTPRDVVFDERNIDFLVDGGVRLALSFTDENTPV